MAVFGFGRRNAVGRQYNGGNVSVMLPRYTTPPERNTRDWLEMFGRNPRLAVVDRIASDLSTCTGKLYRKDENGEEVEITDHPFLNFMAHPNPLYEMTSGACWRLQQIYLELKGEGYFVYEFDALGRPVELWPLPTHWVQQTPYVGYPYYEIRTTGGLIRQIPVDDIFCMKELNPLDPYKRGLGAAESLADEIETDEYAAKFQKKFFYNDATPTTLISMPGSNKDQRDRFRSEWNERFRGPFNSHGIATVDGNVTVTKLAENMRDMDMTEGRRFLRDAVLEHFGVPREIMGITESSNRATSEAAQYIYAQNVIMPRLNRREEAINTQILPFYGNDLVWHFDDVVPRSQEFDKAKGIDGWNAGLLTKDEARELLGMEPCKTGGDCFKITISDMFIGSNDDPAEVTTDLMQESTDGVEVTDDEDTGGMLSKHCSLLIVAHRRLLRAVLIKTNDLRRNVVQRFQGSFIVLPQLGILQTLQDAPFLRFVQRGRERLVFLFQLSVFDSRLRKSDLIAVQLGAHFGHCRDIAVQHLADLRRTALAVEGGDAHQQSIQLLLLLGQLGHLLEDAGRDVLQSGLAGTFATLQLRVLLDHVLPELVLPLHKILAVADDFLGAQPSISSQRHKAEVQVGRFLVHVDNSRDEGFGILLASQELQGVLEIRLDLAARLALEKLRAGGDKRLYHPHAILADTAVGGGYHAVGFFPVPALRLHQMEVVAAPARVDVRVAGVLLLGALVVGFDGADGRPLVLFEP